jgi:hypothetical protein
MARAGGPVGEAADALARTCGFSEAEQRAILALVAAGPALDGETFDRLSTTALAPLRQREFDWPEFDHWHAVFARQGTFPPLWEGLERPPGRDASSTGRQAYQSRKLFLLIDWLHGLAVTRAEIRTALTRYSARGLPAEIARQSAAIACPACDPLDQERVPSDARHLPPYHPGCRCLILASRGMPRLRQPVTG